MRTNIRDRYRAPAAPAEATAPATHHQPPHHSKPKKIRSFFSRRWLLLVIVLLIAGLAALAYEYVHTKNQLNEAKNPSLAGKTETDQITNQVNKSVDLPTGETPTLATVKDVSKLKTQTFFKTAKNGDKVLIYSKAGWALLYRSSTKKVIEYAPVNLGTNQQ